MKLIDWFKEAKWGVFNHYLAKPASFSGWGNVSSEEWNRYVDSFDTDTLAKQLNDIGAAYYFITLGQGTGHWCVPNPVWDKYVPRRPSLAAKRDLVSDLYDSLSKYGIKLGLYLPAALPRNDQAANAAFEWTPWYNTVPTEDDIAGFSKWLEVIRYWGEHYGDKVFAWWVDGVHGGDALLRSDKEPNMKSYTDAFKAGYPERLIGYNPGLFSRLVTVPDSGEDYTAGEVDFMLHLPGVDYKQREVWPGRWVHGEQFHFLAFLGCWWGQGEPRFNDDLVVGYTKLVNDFGGVMTWDVPVSMDGRLPDAFVRQLKVLGERLGKPGEV